MAQQKKLGSLLGVEEDVTRRIQLANASFNKLEKLWKALEASNVGGFRCTAESVSGALRVGSSL